MKLKIGYLYYDKTDDLITITDESNGIFYNVDEVAYNEDGGCFECGGNCDNDLVREHKSNKFKEELEKIKNDKDI